MSHQSSQSTLVNLWYRFLHGTWDYSGTWARRPTRPLYSMATAYMRWAILLSTSAAAITLPRALRHGCISQYLPYPPRNPSGGQRSTSERGRSKVSTSSMSMRQGRRRMLPWCPVLVYVEPQGYHQWSYVDSRVCECIYPFAPCTWYVPHIPGLVDAICCVSAPWEIFEFPSYTPHSILPLPLAVRHCLLQLTTWIVRLPVPISCGR